MSVHFPNPRCSPLSPAICVTIGLGFLFKMIQVMSDPILMATVHHGADQFI